MHEDERAPGTSFLPAERTTPNLLAAEIARAAQSPIVTALLEASEGCAAVLDANRQVIAFNTAFLSETGIDEPARTLGLRPGEALDCLHVERSSGSCGTTDACPSCGAALAILAAMRTDRPAERRCALATSRGGERLDREFRARATPFRLDGERFLLLSLHDVSAESRRALLERSFVHDVANLATGLESAAEELLPGGDAVAEDLRRLAHQLAHEVRLQRILAGGDGATALRAARRPFEASDAVELLRLTFAHHPLAGGRTVEWPRVPTGLLVPADPSVLHHVLFNMVANALEAVPPGGRIRVEVLAGPGRTSLRVWNPGAIPAAVVPRIFQRHFSTKPEPGHGYGTWSMKLFGEQILGGEVSFETSPAAGTTFQIAFPGAAC